MRQGCRKYSRTANFIGFTAHRTTRFGLTATLESQAADENVKAVFVFLFGEKEKSFLVAETCKK